MSDFFGSDFSDWQPHVDFDVYKSSGRPFVFLKASEGTHNVQDTLGSHRAEAHRVGLTLVGLYHYARPGDAQAQVDHFVGTIGSVSAGEVAVLDAEEPGLSEDWCREWLVSVEEQTGRTPLLYCSWSYWSDVLGSMSDYPLWIAAYGNEDPRGDVPNCRLWQYTDRAPVPGAGRVDDNRFAGTMGELAAIGGGPTRGRRFTPTTTGWAEIDRYLAAQNVAINVAPEEWQTTGGQHSPMSWHYRAMGRDYSAGMGCDEVAIAEALRPFAVPGGPIIELFHAPTDTWVSHGQRAVVGGHTDHVHAAIAPGRSLPGALIEEEETIEEEEEMASPNVLFNHGGGVFVRFSDGGLLPLVNNEQVNSLLAGGAPSLGDISDEQFDRLNRKVA